MRSRAARGPVRTGNNAGQVRRSCVCSARAEWARSTRRQHANRQARRDQGDEVRRSRPIRRRAPASARGEAGVARPPPARGRRHRHRHPRGPTFLVMEYLEGEDLAALRRVRARWRSTSWSTSCCRICRRWRRRTPPASFIAISSRRTSSSRAASRRDVHQRCSTSGSRKRRRTARSGRRARSSDRRVTSRPSRCRIRRRSARRAISTRWASSCTNA